MECNGEAILFGHSSHLSAVTTLGFQEWTAVESEGEINAKQDYDLLATAAARTGGLTAGRVRRGGGGGGGNGVGGGHSGAVPSLVALRWAGVRWPGTCEAGWRRRRMGDGFCGAFAVVARSGRGCGVRHPRCAALRRDRFHRGRPRRLRWRL